METQFIPTAGYLERTVSKMLRKQPPLEYNLPYSLKINDQIGATFVGYPLVTEDSVSKIGFKVTARQTGDQFLAISTHTISCTREKALELGKSKLAFRKPKAKCPKEEWYEKVEIYAEDRISAQKRLVRGFLLEVMTTY